jgi:hypothetical protein
LQTIKKQKIIFSSRFFNVDAYSYGEASYAKRLVEKRLATGYHRGAKYTEREKRKGKNCLTELY